MPCVSFSSYEVGLLSLIGCGFEFGVNRFEKEYLRKCAFWQRLQAGMYGAHVSLESGVRSLGSPLESVPLPDHHPPPPATRLPIPRETTAARRKGEYSCYTTVCVWSFSRLKHTQACTQACTHRQTQHSHSHWYICAHTNMKKPRWMFEMRKKGTGLVILTSKITASSELLNYIASSIWNSTQNVETQRKSSVGFIRVCLLDTSCRRGLASEAASQQGKTWTDQCKGSI